MEQFLLIIPSVIAGGAAIGVGWLTGRLQRKTAREVSIYKRLELLEQRHHDLEKEFNRKQRKMTVAIAYIQRLVFALNTADVEVPPAPAGLEPDLYL